MIDEIYAARNKNSDKRISCTQIGNEAFRVYHALWKNGNLRFEVE